MTRAAQWPQSLFGRLILILSIGLVAAHALSFALVLTERSQATAVMMINYLARDIGSSIAILDRLPATERATWLPKLERRNYRYTLTPAVGGVQADTAVAQHVAMAVANTLGPSYAPQVFAAGGRNDALLITLRLRDGSPLGIQLGVAPLPLSPWVIVVLAFQLLLLFVFSWFAVKLVTRPLADLAQAANSLKGPELKGVMLSENGPVEVANAAGAFNAMQRRLRDYVSERLKLLAAISHDLQTPITRMRLRADLLDDTVLREKLYRDLDAMQGLVQEVITYARDGQGVTETPCSTDLDALLDSLVLDYGDAGKAVTLTGAVGSPISTRPLAVKRVLVNLIDNALKFGRQPELTVLVEDPWISIAVMDRGPGIREDELSAVINPFYRVEGSRNRETGGAGLGLAIAHQLSAAVGGALDLTNRKGGGLTARLRLPLRWS